LRAVLGTGPNAPQSKREVKERNMLDFAPVSRDEALHGTCHIQIRVLGRGVDVETVRDGGAGLISFSSCASEQAGRLHHK
jgi:hypothetical protein